jgi:hypothetical protein
MTSADQLLGWVEIGDRVYVDPHHPDSPWKTEGLAGIVEKVVDNRARVAFHQNVGGQTKEVPLAVLRRDRRVARQPGRWA